MKRPEPERTCVGCRQKATKGSLVRIVRTADGKLRVDPTGKVPGRGAYVHRARECASVALHKGALARTLKVALGAEEVASLVAEIEEVLGE
jgi:predicted RNA-binding protein YlxR (DUF448 family)